MRSEISQNVVKESTGARESPRKNPSGKHGKGSECRTRRRKKRMKGCRGSLQKGRRREFLKEETVTTDEVEKKAALGDREPLPNHADFRGPVRNHRETPRNGFLGGKVSGGPDPRRRPTVNHLPIHLFVEEMTSPREERENRATRLKAQDKERTCVFHSSGEPVRVIPVECCALYRTFFVRGIPCTPQNVTICNERRTAKSALVFKAPDVVLERVAKGRC